MKLRKDFKELLESLNAKSVEFVIVGAYALAFHGAPRFTGDLDIFVRPTETNSQRIISALDKFGFVSSELNEQDFFGEDNVVQIGVSPIRVGFLTSLTGVDWQQVENGKVQGDYDGVPGFYIGREEYIANKKALGRLKDLADLEALGEM